MNLPCSPVTVYCSWLLRCLDCSAGEYLHACNKALKDIVVQETRPGRSSVETWRVHCTL